MSEIKSRILTTTACNARCEYCYEKGTPVLWMDERAADDTADFLTARAENSGGSVALEWFGGEPTLHPGAADRICARLREAGVLYRSSIVTNGLLADRCLKDHRNDLWNLRLAQVTLDGTSQRHEAVKGFQPGAFDRILRNVDAFAGERIRVKIRLNFKDNFDEIGKLIDALAGRFSGNPHIFVYISPVYNAEKSYPESVMLPVLRLNDRLIAAGLASERMLYGLRERSSRCFMMEPDGFTVAPDGRLYNCSHCINADQCVGSVRDYDPEHPIRKAFLNADVSEECRLCSAFSICKGGCRVGELGLAEMPQCHPFRCVMDTLQNRAKGFLCGSCTGEPLKKDF